MQQDWPVGHAQVHVPATQVCPGEQVIPQAPQWRGSLRRSTQAMPHWVRGDVQVVTVRHRPAMQVSAAVQALPQVPQCIGSRCGSTQVEAQRIWPGSHMSASGMAGTSLASSRGRGSSGVTSETGRPSMGGASSGVASDSGTPSTVGESPEGRSISGTSWSGCGRRRVVSGSTTSEQLASTNPIKRRKAEPRMLCPVQ